jgi:hypothetical protein
VAELHFSISSLTMQSHSRFVVFLDIDLPASLILRKLEY